MISNKRDKQATMLFFRKAMVQHGKSNKVAMNTSGANKAAIDQIIKDDQTSITVRQVKYFNNIIEQDHRAVKRIKTRARLQTI